ncbi:co-chaperone GroES [candidate division KSB1 bacterium]|nr:co-chaperone GroES [candidate division KSB1 bacterium]MBL7092810.1 co-chaperone GroES [candidate division KSB1 bacterium]
MKVGKEIVVIGDRILISVDSDKNRTESGLYLPQGLAEKEKVRSGYIVKTGPGYIFPHTDSSEPWRKSEADTKYIPLQVRTGDYAIFLRKDAVEIEYDEKKYLIVSQSGILAVVRDELKTDDSDEE